MSVVREVGREKERFGVGTEVSTYGKNERIKKQKTLEMSLVHSEIIKNFFNIFVLFRVRMKWTRTGS